LPLRVEGNKAFFILPKRLMVKDAKVTDARVKVHMMISPGKPLTCDIPDMLVLPYVWIACLRLQGVFFHTSMLFGPLTIFGVKGK